MNYKLNQMHLKLPYAHGKNATEFDELSLIKDHTRPEQYIYIIRSVCTAIFVHNQCKTFRHTGWVDTYVNMWVFSREDYEA
jgi:hypothetical protein